VNAALPYGLVVKQIAHAVRVLKALQMPFLSARGLSGLKNYKYQSAGYTLLDDIHQPFWNCEALIFASGA